MRISIYILDYNCVKQGWFIWLNNCMPQFSFEHYFFQLNVNLKYYTMNICMNARSSWATFEKISAYCTFAIIFMQKNILEALREMYIFLFFTSLLFIITLTATFKIKL